MKFHILKKSRRSRARVGVLETSHGTVETPALVPVATQAAVKALPTELVEQTDTQLLICNTFHLHLKPGKRVVQRAGGLHQFMGWRRPLMTDSGGFQVFSLGHGRSLGLNKVAKPGAVRAPARQSWVKIREDGVEFRSPLDGRKLFLGPGESMRIQAALGADIIFAFDECPPPAATKTYHRAALDRTHRWAVASLKAHRTRQALYGIIQGGPFKDLRVASAKFIAALPFDGFGIGGEFGAEKRRLAQMVGWVNDALPEDKPRHLLGIGYPEDLAPIVRAGVDTFDITVPTHMARRGIAYTSQGKLDLRRSAFVNQYRPLDSRCQCFVCAKYTRAYLAHLMRAKEITGLSLLTFHNLHWFNQAVARHRQSIRQGKL